MTGSGGQGIGTPQGGVISPLLANIYMRRFLLAWENWGLPRRLEAHVVNYADDSVILCRDKAAGMCCRIRRNLPAGSHSTLAASACWRVGLCWAADDE